jgi:hypothetical protein
MTASELIEELMKAEPDAVVWAREYGEHGEYVVGTVDVFSTTAVELGREQ